MGATLWHYHSRWHERPGEALEEIQAKLIAEKYDLAKILPEQLENARNSIDSCLKEGDPYDIIGIYQEQFDFLERLCSEPVPQDTKSQLEIIRRLNAYSGQGVGNILDVTGVSVSRGLCIADSLDDDEMRRLIGTNQPTWAESQKAISEINGDLNRGECVCFRFYDSERKNAIGWFFVGNTVD